MAVEKTERLGVTRWPLGTDPYRRQQRNEDADALEAVVAKYGAGTLAALPAPAPANAGTYYTVTDPAGGGRLGALYYSTGSAWLELNTGEARTGFAELFLHGGS